MRAGEMWKAVIVEGKTSRGDVLGVFGERERSGRSWVEGNEEERSVEDETFELREEVVVEEEAEFVEEEVRARRRRAIGILAVS